MLCLLTTWLLIHTLVVNKRSAFLTNLFVILFTSVILAIKTKSTLIFYAFFELSVVPITLIVFMFGYQPEKLRACLHLVLYTVVSSIPLLLFMIIIGEAFINLYPIHNCLSALPITLCFMVKSPMYVLHTWLPKAHGEAPVGGSIMLAGVLLKLGSYGLLVFLPYVNINPLITFFFSITLLGSWLRSLTCLRQGDMKALIAYSSVVHMSVVIIGLLNGSELGYSCAIIMVLRHGVTSPFIFAMAYWLYESSHSRLMTNNLRMRPLMTWRFFGLISLNMSVPPSLSVWAEVIMAACVLFTMRYSIFFLLGYFFLSALYNLHLYTACIHSKYSQWYKHIDNKSLISIGQTLFLCYSSFFCLDLFHV